MAYKKTAEEPVTAPRFTKAQLMSSRKYADRKDLIGALLDDGIEYTVSQVDGLIENFLKGKVI